MCDHDEAAEKYRDELVARARLENGAAWDAAVGNAAERVRMVEGAEFLMRIEASARGGAR
jgi:hypothetical protein